MGISRIDSVPIPASDLETAKAFYRAELAAKRLAMSAIEAAPWARFATCSGPERNGWVLQQAAPGA